MLRTPVSHSASYEGLLTGWAQHEVDTDCCANETVACITCVTSMHDSIPCYMMEMGDVKMGQAVQMGSVGIAFRVRWTNCGC